MPLALNSVPILLAKMAPKIKPSPQFNRPASIVKAAAIITAWVLLFGAVANLSIKACAAGLKAKACPKTRISTICIEKANNSQNPLYQLLLRVARVIASGLINHANIGVNKVSPSAMANGEGIWRCIEGIIIYSARRKVTVSMPSAKLAN